jgi:hypothetical protein
MISPFLDFTKKTDFFGGGGGGSGGGGGGGIKNVRFSGGGSGNEMNQKQNNKHCLYSYDDVAEIINASDI